MALKQNKPLVAKTRLIAKITLKREKKRRKPTPLAKKSAQQLVGEADKWFSKYVRLRDSELVDGQWVATCICCTKQMVVYAEGKWKQGCDAGHYKSRGFHNIRYDEENVSAQNSYCNAWKDKDDMLTGYKAGLQVKYGDNVPAKLDKLSKAPDARKILPKQELLQIIEDSKTQVAFYLDNA